MTPSTPNQPAPAKPEHSALPWRVRRMQFASNFDKTPRFAVETDGQTICQTRPVKAAEDAEFGYDEAATRANAEMIVRAVNNHAALVAQLKNTVSLCEGLIDAMRCHHLPVDEATEQRLVPARAAIRNATK